MYGDGCAPLSVRLVFSCPPPPPHSTWVGERASSDPRAMCVCVCFQINVQCVGKHRQPQCLKLRRPLVLSRLPVFWPLFVFPSRAAAVARVLNTSKCTVHLMEFGAHFGILVPIPAACCPPPRCNAASIVRSVSVCSVFRWSFCSTVVVLSLPFDGAEAEP